MKRVCVITGGGSGMGLSAAKFLPKDTLIVLAGRTLSKLDHAVKELTGLGYEAYAQVCDTQNRKSVHELALFAQEKGQVQTLIHAAGISPGMADAEALLRINALGTVYINEEFAKVMDHGVIVDISSNSAYALPGFLVSEKTYALASTDETAFLKKCLRLPRLIRDPYKQAGLAYAISKNFVVWYAQKCAFQYGPKGIRVCSLSPGLIATDMGRLEEKEGGAMLAYSAQERMGTPEELGFAIAMAADERNGYLCGVDILVDGGSTNGKRFKRR